MHKLYAIALVGSIVGQSFSFAQNGQTGQWRNFTDMKSVRSVAVSSSRVVAATGGGMFMYDERTEKYSTWTNSESLSTNDLTALMVDKNNNVWVGSSNGAIDVFDQSANSWQTIQDIAGSTRPQKAIREFFGKGDSVYVVSDFGVSVFIVSRWEFGDTYANFGFATQPAVSSVLVSGNQVFVGTNQGVAIASLSSPNLSAPSSWTTYGAAQGLSTTGVTAMTVYNDTLVVGTSNGLFAFANNLFQLDSSSAGRSIAALVSTPTALFYLWNNASGFTVESSGQTSDAFRIVATEAAVQASSLALDSGASTIVVGTTGQGVTEWNGSQWSPRAPNGPESNLFINLYVTGDGVLWAGSGIGGGGEGFYRYDPSLADSVQWKNFTVADYPVMGSNDYYKVSPGANGSVWISSWGDGVVEIVDDTIFRRISVPPFAATVQPANPGGPYFLVVGGVANDAQGVGWFANRTAINGNFLVELVNDTSFEYQRCASIACDGFFASMVIDQNGTKWIANAEPTQKLITGPVGLYYYNQNLTVAGTENTGGWGMMTTSDGLPNDIILSLAVDQDNSVWVGTDLGVTIITNPQNPSSGLISSFPLREQSIQAIAVDGLNDKWIGTKQGVFVVNSDGTQLLNQYTVINTNGKLVDDDVRSIAIDQRRGIAYLGTQKGLSSLQIAPVQPLQSYAKLVVGPNPYILPNSQPLSINNLVANSTIKILSVNGTLITEFEAQGGGRAFWDGRDRHGKYVATGIYFVVAFADNGNQVANGKVAVVRK